MVEGEAAMQTEGRSGHKENIDFLMVLDDRPLTTEGMYARTACSHRRRHGDQKVALSPTALSSAAGDPRPPARMALSGRDGRKPPTGPPCAPVTMPPLVCPRMCPYVPPLVCHRRCAPTCRIPLVPHLVCPRLCAHRGCALVGTPGPVRPDG